MRRGAAARERGDARRTRRLESAAAPAGDDLVALVIDGTPVEVARGTTILDAAHAAGVRIPTLCFLRDVSAISSCRVCVVEVEGADALMPACSTAAAEGMKVSTASGA